MEKIGFVSCVKQKDTKPQPAKYLYISVLFTKAREYVLRCYDQWYILSAKYHLLDPNTEIEPYDETLNQKSASERHQWTLHVYKQIRKLLPAPSEYTLYFHAGLHYREFLIKLLKEAGYHCESPLEGLGIGQQLKWYKQYEETNRCQSDF